MTFKNNVMKNEHPELTKKRKAWQQARKEIIEWAEGQDWKTKQKMYKDLKRKARFKYL